MNITKAKEEFIEKGAALEHARWAKWQNYLHSFLTWNDELKAWVLPHEQKDRWQCQINTYYDMLSEKEKESDRKEVRQYLPLIDKIIALAHQSGREEMKQECIKAVPEKKVFDSMDTTLLKTRGEVRAWNSCREQMLGNLKKYEKEA